MVEFQSYKLAAEGSIPSSCTSAGSAMAALLPSKQEALGSNPSRRSNRGWTRSSEVEPAAHNRLVLGSKPSGSTKLPGSSSAVQSAELLPRMSGVRIPPARPSGRKERGDCHVGP